MKLKLACADFTFPLLPHDKVLDLIAAMDFGGVDLGLFEGRSHLRPSVEFARPQSSGGRLRRTLRDRGLRAADVFLQSAPDFVAGAINHPRARARAHSREWFRRALDYADALESKHVSILPGAVFPQEKRAVSLDRSADELTWRVEQSAAAGITLGIEAHVGSILPSPGAALDLVSRVPGLTLTLDYTHFTRMGLPDRAIQPLVAVASHFHARGARHRRIQCGLDRNTIDYRGVLAAMKSAGYSGWIGVEYVWTTWERCNECDNVSETIQMRALLRKAAAKL